MYDIRRRDEQGSVSNPAARSLSCAGIKLYPTLRAPESRGSFALYRSNSDSETSWCPGKASCPSIYLYRHNWLSSLNSTSSKRIYRCCWGSMRSELSASPLTLTRIRCLPRINLSGHCRSLTRQVMSFVTQRSI